MQIHPGPASVTQQSPLDYVRQLNRRLAHRRRELDLIYAVGDLLQHEQSHLPHRPQVLARRILGCVLRHLGGSRAALRAAADDLPSMNLAAARDSAGRLRFGPPPAATAALATEVRGSGEPRIVPLTVDGRPYQAPADPLSGAVCALVPVSAGGAAYGVLELWLPRFDQLCVETIAILTAVADQIGFLLQGAALTARIEAMAVQHERRRVARDLHDSVIHSLYSIGLFAGSGRQALLNEQDARQLCADLPAQLQRIEELSLGALRELRALIHDLEPVGLRDGGLVAVLHRRLVELDETAGIRGTLKVDEPLTLPVEIATALLRIADEALANARRHAAPGRVEVELRCRHGRAHLAILDDGIGFDPTAVMPGRGLRNMRARAAELGGALTLQSSPGGGTSLRVTIPLPGTEQLPP